MHMCAWNDAHFCFFVRKSLEGRELDRATLAALLSDLHDNPDQYGATIVYK